MMSRAAVRYAVEGCWFVFPVEPLGKIPLVPWGDEATFNPDTVRGWWQRHPEANIGVACGPSGLVVVDVDGPEGVQSLARLGRDLPSTLTAQTGRGHHYYYKAPTWPLGNTAGRLPGIEGALRGVDLRADGGYIITPPSIHPSGRRYRWLSGPVEPAACPSWLRPLPRPKAPAARVGVVGNAYALAALREEVGAVGTTKPGRRNDRLNSAAFSLGQLVGAGLLDAADVASLLLGAAGVCGLPDREARRTVASGLGSGIAQPREVA